MTLAITAYRGTTKTFRFDFFADDNRTVPIIPVDPMGYPRVQIRDLNGDVVVTATPPTVRADPVDGYWNYDFEVPLDADLTGDGQSWTFLAEITASSGRVDSRRIDFSVKDSAAIKASNAQHVISQVEGRAFDVFYRALEQPHSLTFTLVNSTGGITIVNNATVGTGAGNIKHRYDNQNGVHVYRYTVPATKTSGVSLADVPIGDYLAMWGVVENEDESEDVVYNTVTIVPVGLLVLVPQVRQIVDKLRKARDSVQAINEAEIISGLQYGTQLVNAVMPSTDWSASTMPDPVKPYTIVAAALWVYLAQLGLSVDLQFNFSGQTTVLDQDQTGGIESMMSRFENMVNTNLVASKKDILRHMRSVGVVGTRMSRSRSRNRVYKMQSTDGQQLQTLLIGLGLV